MVSDSDKNQIREYKIKTVSLSTFLLVVILVAVISYIAGTRSDQISSKIGSTLGFSTTDSSLDTKSIREVYDTIREKYDGNIDTSKLEDGAISGMTSALGDRYTEFFSAQDASKFQDSLNGRISGIGAEIGIRNDQPTILRTIDDSPARKAGLLKGDQIIKVNEKSTLKATSEKTANLIKGEEGTAVKISVLRSGQEKQFTITRAQVTDASVASRVSGDTGIITIRRFDSTTGDLAKRVAEKLKADGVKSIILDLRDNGGGELEQTPDVAGLWLSKGDVVVTVKKRSKIDQELKTTGTPILEGMKTIVLTNGATASASEIVAGALKDHGAATILGEKTFGKGSVQQVINLDGGRELKITIAKWYTPNDRNINEKGIEPDIKVELTKDDANSDSDPQMDEALKRL